MNNDIRLDKILFEEELQRKMVRQENKPPFEKYLVMVGYRADKYNYSHYLILDHIEYFRKCYDENKGVYTALVEFKKYLGYTL